MTFNVRTLRDGTITCSILALALACATGTLEDEGEGDGDAGRGTAGTPGPTAGSAGSSTGSVAGQGSAGVGANAGAGGKATAGGAGGTTGGALGGGSGGVGGSASTSGGGGSTSTGGAQGEGGTGGVGGTLGNGGSSASGGSAGMPGGSGGGSGKGGMGGTGGATGGNAGKGGSGNASGSGGSGTGGSAGGSSSACATWPTANGSQSVSSTIQVSGTYDGAFKRFSGSGPLGSGGQQENQDPLFELANGATLKNVIIGNPASDGVHCEGNCTLENVWWEDVGEDAATFRGNSGSQTMTVRCGGAKNAMDKIFQHNGGGTLTVEDFQIDGFSKLYRSCGNCSSQMARHVVLRGVTARSGSTLVGINTNYGDSADFERITVYGNITICERYTGNNNGGEPVKTGSGSDGQYCRYEASDITQR